MRAPQVEGRVHVRAPAAAAVLDAANAAYALMLRALCTVYDNGDNARRPALLGCATAMMAVLAQLADRLTELPADAPDGVRAGVSFTMLRSTEGWAPGVDPAVPLREQLTLLQSRMPQRDLGTARTALVREKIGKVLASLG